MPKLTDDQVRAAVLSTLRCEGYVGGVDPYQYWWGYTGLLEQMRSKHPGIGWTRIKRALEQLHDEHGLVQREGSGWRLVRPAADVTP